MRILRVRKMGGIYTSICKVPAVQTDQVLQQGMSEECLGLPPTLVCGRSAMIPTSQLGRSLFLHLPPSPPFFYLSFFPALYGRVFLIYFCFAFNSGFCCTFLRIPTICFHWYGHSFDEPKKRISLYALKVVESRDMGS